MTRARAPTDRSVAARLGRLPRNVWGRFAARFKQLTRCNKVRATASPMQNVRLAFAKRATPSASKTSTTKSPKGRSRRTRRRGAIPVWVLECALTAAALAIAAEGVRYLPTDTEHTFYIQTQIRRGSLSREVVDKIRTSLMRVDNSSYPLHITLVTVKCPLAKKKDVSRYINKTVKHDVQSVIDKERKYLTFRIYSVATDFGRGKNLVVAKCNLQPYGRFVDTMRDYKTKWKCEFPEVEWRLETNFHITLGSYRTQQVRKKDLEHIRNEFEKGLNNNTYCHSDLFPVTLANP